MRGNNIVLGVTASIAIYKACEIARRLVNHNFSLDIIMTKNAVQLISPQVFSSLIKGSVYWDEFQDPANWEIEHISLAKKADLILIAPATANIIGKIANGIADDLLSTTVMATRAPVLIVPAMNENMYKSKIVQGNIEKLKNLGYKFVGPRIGKLACGEVGVGHLAEIETIAKEAKKLLR
ncbi:MAG: flavoprotein [Candidatus Omnitrophota bacterium]|jgi:phosphopantothenoylcysteine decarboxylase/phosphopantothenate--cysteine ligase